MRYFILCFFVIVNLIYAKVENVEITSKSFMADELKHISKFIGNVKVVKGYDTITSKTLIVNFDKNRKPVKYTAIGNAKFKLILNNKHYAGKADKIIYLPFKKTYNFIGNVFLQEIDSGKKIYGDNVTIDQENGKYSVLSNGNKPVKFIFKIEDKSK